jgi:tetratricopeptide (TPR) repeat protein
MTERGWDVARVEELDRFPVVEGLEWRPIRRRFGIRAFGVNAYTSERVGGWIVEEHTEQRLGHEEIYVVLAGRARFALDGEEVDAPAGTIVHLRNPAVRRGAISEEEGTTVLAVGGRPGAAFEPSAWEWFFEATARFKAGDRARAFEILDDGLRAKPGNAAMLYNLACLEALDGRREQALEHLRESIALDETMAGYAREDPDFDALRDEVSAIAGQAEPGRTAT